MPITNEDVWAELQNIKRDLGAVSEQVTLDSATLANINSILTASQGAQTSIQALAPLVVTPASSVSIGTELASNNAAPTSTTTAANQRVYVPVQIVKTATLLDTFFVKGSGTLAGNVDISVYDSTLTKVVSTGSVAVSGATGLLQKVAIADTSLSAGRYYMSIAFNDATNTVYTWTIAGSPRGYGVLMENSAFTAPATGTPGTADNFVVPIFGLSFTSLLT